MPDFCCGVIFHLWMLHGEQVPAQVLPGRESAGGAFSLTFLVGIPTMMV
jgi:hypothetical protein